MSAAGRDTWATRWWLAHWGLWRRRWHRYTVEGLEHLVDAEGPRLIVGYHGRPIAHDLCILQCELHARLGYLPHPLFHAAFDQAGFTARVVRDLGFLTGEGPELAAAVARGEHLIVTPGGTREGCRSQRHRYRVDWGGRTGYLRLAMRHRLPLVPVAARGADDAFFGLNDGYRLGKRLGLPAGVPAWVGLGLAGVWPLAIPFPVRFQQRVGPPIAFDAEGAFDPEARDPATRALLDRMHARVTGAVQGLLDDLTGRP